MALPVIDNYSIATNASWVRPYQVVNNGQPQPLDNCQIAMQVVQQVGKSLAFVATLSLGSGIAITNMEQGNFEVDTTLPANVQPGLYSYDILLTQPDGTNLQIVTGTMTVTQGFSKPQQ